MNSSEYDLAIVDEAYQATSAQVEQSMAGVPQILMVGDPGQIGPVVTVDTSIWQGHKDAPHRPAPLSPNSISNDVVRLNINTTYRLGARSADVVAPIYPFDFVSGRPERHVTRRNEQEILNEIVSVSVPHSESVDDIEVLQAMVERASSYVGGELVEGDKVRPLRDTDIALVVSRNSQVSILTGMARSMGHSFVIGTADRLQGGEWPVVLSLDPMFGTHGESEHNQSLGRLCVMLTRHTTHLVWFHDDTWEEATKGGGRDAKKNRVVRERIIGQKVKESPVVLVDLFDPGF